MVIWERWLRLLSLTSGPIAGPTLHAIGLVTRLMSSLMAGLTAS